MNALLIIDIQNDFLPGGSLAVPEGDTIIPVVNELQQHFDLVVATQDWHPANHGSFASSHSNKKPGDVVDLNGTEQVLWPDHCVQYTNGAEFAESLDKERFSKIIQKGTDAGIDSYSGFFDNKHKRATGLQEYLSGKMTDKLFLTGLAADICVKYTAIDALELGYETFVVKDATKAVGGAELFNTTMYELEMKGAKIVSTQEVLSLLHVAG